MRIPVEILLFAVSGVIGFLVDTAVLYGLHGSMGPYLARIVSFLAAVFSTWLFNRAITFHQRKSRYSKKGEFLFYLMLMLAGGAVNYGVYSWLVQSSQLVRQHLVLGVAAGSLAGMWINFLTSRYLLFRKRRQAPMPPNDQ